MRVAHWAFWENSEQEICVCAWSCGWAQTLLVCHRDVTVRFQTEEKLIQLTEAQLIMLENLFPRCVCVCACVCLMRVCYVHAKGCCISHARASVESI